MSKELVFQSVESLQQVVNVINEAVAALNDKTRTIWESPIPEVLAGALGAGIGGKWLNLYQQVVLIGFQMKKFKFSKRTPLMEIKTQHSNYINTICLYL